MSIRPSPNENNLLDLNEDNLFVYLITCQDYNSSWDDAIVPFLILADTIEEATKLAHVQMSQYSHYRIIKVEFIGSVGIYTVTK